MPRSITTRGFTLLEVIIASTVLMLVIGAALFLLSSTNRTVGDQLAITDTAQRANNLSATLSRELRAAGELNLSGQAGVTATGFFTRITYNEMTGFDWANGAPEFNEAIAAQRQIRFVPAESSAANGTDDDNDGLVDEGNLILFFDADDSGTFDAGEERGIIARDVAGDTISFALMAGGAPTGAQTRGPNDTHLLVTFETLRRLPSDTRQIVHRERISLQLALRNQP